MDPRVALLSALHTNPGDRTCWLALADALEEEGETERAELTRLLVRLREEIDHPAAWEWEERLRQLLRAGVSPCVPEVVNSLGMRLALIPPGVFWMGTSEVESRHEDERPRHRVRITQPFYLGVFPVTQEQYQAITGQNPASFSKGGEDREKVKGLETRAFPVENISWEDAAAFCTLLSERPQEVAAGRAYRLPTEAEWEYACRAGTTTAFWLGPGLSSFQANFDGGHPFGGASEGPNLTRPTPVGMFAGNGFGLFDVHGNVWEWCADWYEAELYTGAEEERDPVGPPPGVHRQRVLRGGAWFEFATDCRSAFRLNRAPDSRRHVYGFRVAMNASVGAISSPRS